MNLTELKELIRSGENERLEFKKSTGQRTDAAKTVCAMLNGLSGFVLFGITDRGEIIGQHVSANTLNDIANELGRIEPPAILDMKTIVLPNGKSVIVLNISAGGGPYVYDGRPYARHGSTTQRIPQQRYERMLLERMHAKHRWENQPAEGISLKDLDRSEITRTVEEAIRRQRMEEPGTRNAHN
ncbi:MAG: ATP-binding protein, partial [Proteobacteria bacterium]|nr:ATP-binding protein [Pseudomonadota bacterium]